MNVPQRGCVITWDFDILKGDVTFTVFRCKSVLNKETYEHPHHVGGQVVSTQYIDKSMQVGPDLSIVEPPHICRDGDSVQVCRSLNKDTLPFVQLYQGYIYVHLGQDLFIHTF
ncbi:hypothetical protein DPMN_035068 [Dreissena polymorpha]|uniref:Uncharacterized protein n=1 Tax=Dreissena polymorpha TaxID=45954 RepID=A0A9D4M7Z9_DREPO|nr:hypothetical protein DPMN_035068 [Dreissena polymorpha]